MKTLCQMRTGTFPRRSQAALVTPMLVLIAACGGVPANGAPPVAGPGTPPPTTVTALRPVTVGVQGVAGALHPQPLQVRLTAGSAPQPGSTVQWATGNGNGWVFPATSVTDAQGIASTWWVPGASTAQTVTAAAGRDTARISAPVAKTENRANSVHLWHDTPGRVRVDGFRIDIVPQTEPQATYYEAIGFDGGYSGIQAGGDLGGKQVIFSVWDANGVNAVLVDASTSLCAPFGNEGTGIKCRFLYPWATGRTYRFELRAAFGASTTDFTAWFTDVAAGTTRKIATLRYGTVSEMSSFYSFVEDFGSPAASCLNAAHRAVILRDPQHRAGGGSWQKFTSARFTSYHKRDVCANISATTGAPGGGILLTTGGSVVGDPTASTTLAVP